MADKNISSLKAGGQAAVPFPDLKSGGQAAAQLPASMATPAPKESPIGRNLLAEVMAKQTPYTGIPMKNQPAYSGPVEPAQKTLLQQMLDDLSSNYRVTDGGYRNLINSLNARAPEDRARLQALYDTYSNDIAGQAEGIGQNYAQSATALGGAYDTSKANIQAAYDAARQAQTERLRNLGMEQLATTDPFGANGAQAIAAQEALRAAVLAQNDASRNAAITNNQLAVSGAKREGVGKIASFDRSVADALMQLQAKQQAAEAASVNQLAQLRQNAYSNAAKISQTDAANQLKADIAAMRWGNQPTQADVQSIIDQVGKTTGTPLTQAELANILLKAK